MIARLRARLAHEDGMTLIELLTSMTILALVLTAVVAMFTSGLRAETDMNTRFQSQQSARLALVDMRNDIGDACSASVATGGASVTLTEPSAVTATLGSCSTGTTTVMWCAASTSGAPYSLYRGTASTCGTSSGVKRVDSLATNAVFSAACTTGSHQLLAVALQVNANLANPHTLYKLGDTMMLRNSAVAASC